MKKKSKVDIEFENKVNAGFAVFVIIWIVGMVVVIAWSLHYAEPQEIKEPIDMKCVGFSNEHNAILILNHTINTPDLLSCEELAWIIENSAYPSGYIEYHKRYIEPSCGSDNNTIISVNKNPHIKEAYDDYFFRNCLTQKYFLEDLDGVK